MNGKGNLATYYGIYLVGFPIAGALVGVLFFYVASLVRSGVSDSFFVVSVGLWTSFGLLAGIVGLRHLLKVKTEAKDAVEP